MRRVPPEVRQFLAPFPKTVQGIALGLRMRILAMVPNAHETIWDASNAVSLAYSTAARRGVGLCHVATFSKHVNLGFVEGATLPDPLGVLQGTGSHIRHASFRQLEETKAAWIDDYLRAALHQAGLTDEMGDGGTTVRVMQGPKRRPN